jgi:diguanylate cyclase (GGDEF)-like protein
MTPELEARLKAIVNFPSPPGVAAHVIELAQNPEADMGSVARTVGMDPALTAKILRTANSALYAQRRRSDNLRQALVVLGINATLTLALSFSLVKTLRNGTVHGLDYNRFWRRALLGATAARALGEAAGHVLGEELFLAGLLQDVGMIALDRSVRDLYAGTQTLQLHKEISMHERKRLGVDHAEVGNWLMRQWNLPARLCQAIELSHTLELRRAASPEEVFVRAVALSGPVADAFLQAEAGRGEALSDLAQQSSRILGIDAVRFGEVIARISALIPETEALFDTSILADPEVVVDQAREILMIRNLHVLREVNTLRLATDSLTARVIELEAETQRDPLTGAFNRGFLEQYLQREFENSHRQGWNLSVAFCDLDHFKSVNDSYGHQAGDRILQATAAILSGSTRSSDVVARYGGEEFVLVLPATDSSTCAKVCKRIVTAFNHTAHDIGAQTIPVTISIGFATLSPGSRYEDHNALVQAADRALCAAKLNGRNQAVSHDHGDVAGNRARLN